MLLEVKTGKRWVKRGNLASFSKILVSMMLPIPLGCFYMRTLHDGLSYWYRERYKASQKGFRTSPTPLDLNESIKLSDGGLDDMEVYGTGRSFDETKGPDV